MCPVIYLVNFRDFTGFPLAFMGWENRVRMGGGMHQDQTCFVRVLFTTFWDEERP